MSFSVNEKVSWESQSAGSTTRKEGVIIFKVPADKAATNRELVQKYNPGHKNNMMFDGCIPRGHVSYVVSVPSKSGKGKPKLYWPKVSQLKKVE